ncbi:24-hydroxycholesterol 7-alpha-hydroxylase [Leptonychotes weddellii]|uniref:24-hydroxycholesterol 7-alpha-hydroxylase n=1 Tax=Leptonychotes weddellii TaxID=9713 RepID=A0A7F8QYI8_LEPWE|nr:24-hydroxycholesterol 7-alpha-hydroxylase [Leptonychotes weddellii]
MELISPTVIIILGCVALLLFLQWKNLRGPPCIRGWIPWIGAGFEFGKAPLEFIEKARIKYGPVFTVFVMGTRMTFVTEEEGINVFLKSKEVNFELAVQKPVYRTASIPKNTFLTLHEKLYIMMKGKIGTFNLYQLTGQLTEELNEQLENLGTHGTMELNNLVRHLLYPVTMNILFKKGLFPTDERKIREFYQHFQAYDEGFEYGSQMPERLLRNWSKSKKWLLALFEKTIPDMKTYRSAKDNSMTLMQAMLDIVETERKEEMSPNYGLLLLWASLSNAVPVAFWTLAFVLSHPTVHETILEGISSVFGTAGKWQNKNAHLMELLGEYGMGTTEVERKGTSSWKQMIRECLQRRPSLRWFALLQIQICIILILYKYDCSLLDPLPKQSPLHLVGVQQPEGQCRIEFKQRK